MNMNRKRLYEKVKKIRKIKFVEVSFIGRFEFIPGYKFVSNMSLDDLERFDFLNEYGYLKTGYVVTEYTTDLIYRRYKGSIALYQEDSDFEPNLQYFKNKVEDAKFEMQMFFDNDPVV